MSNDCIIALDLGTTAFKCAPVNAAGLLAEPTTVAYTLDYAGGQVTFDPAAYERVAAEALAGAARAARERGLIVRAIGISSQAQTYIPLDGAGAPLQHAIVWTDGRAVDEAREAAQRIPDFVQHSGLREPLPVMFMPKLRHLARHSRLDVQQVWKFVLLNEYILYRLTGEVYGDTTNQGMSGFYHIAQREWSPLALDYAGIHADQLARTAPAAHVSAPLASAWCTRLGLDAVPVYSCGNDQSCAAAGAGLTQPGDMLCNFGTAMVVYALQDQLPTVLMEKQMAGISPLTGRYFLLGVESECGNVLDWAHRVLYSGRDFGTMMTHALDPAMPAQGLPRVALPGGGRIDVQGLTVGVEGRHLVRALLELYAETFGVLFTAVAHAQPFDTSRPVYVAGGLSRSQVWLDFLSQKFGITFRRTMSEQPGLIGVARIIERAQQSQSQTHQVQHP
jgi:xylulokinase